MRSCLVLIFILIVAGYLLKTSVSDNPMRSLLENTGTIPPVTLKIESRPWFMNLGNSAHLIFLNKSGQSAIIREGRLVRRNGTMTKLEGLPPLIKPNASAEMKLTDGLTMPGDQIEIFFEGFQIPRTLEFQQRSK